VEPKFYLISVSRLSYEYDDSQMSDTATQSD
jgi:hypothetical protein